MSRFKSIIIIGLALCGFGLSGFLFYGNIKLKKENQLQQAMIDDLNRKKEAVYKKYQEKNALSSQLTRTKSSLEGTVAKARDEAKKIELEKNDILNGNKTLESRINEKDTKIASLEAEAKELSDKLENFNMQIKDAELRQLSDINEFEIKMGKLNSEKQELQSELLTVKRGLETSRTHNAELCVLAEEILSGYENKGLLASLLEKEPFIQSKKVQLEKYTQEYQDKIEKHRQTK